MIKNVTNIVSCIYVTNGLNGENIVVKIHKKSCKKKNQKVFRTKKVIKTKGDIVHAKWKGYNDSINSWIDKERDSIIE